MAYAPYLLTCRRTLNKKLERKISQLEKFEGIIREVTLVQLDLKKNIKTKEQDLQKAKVCAQW